MSSGCEVHVVVRDDRGEVDVLLPCHRDRSLLRPVGWPGADFQGPGARSGYVVLSPRGFGGRSSRVRVRSFAGAASGLRAVGGIAHGVAVPGRDRRAGRLPWPGVASGKDNMAQARRRAAKAEREYGMVRFVAESVDSAMLDRVIQLKRAQYAATRSEGLFRRVRPRLLLGRLLQTRGASFAGILSTVHFGEHLAAAHFGMRAGHVLTLVVSGL